LRISKIILLSDVPELIEINEDSESNLYILSVGKYDTKEELDLVTRKLKDACIDHFVKRKKRSRCLLDKGI